MTTRIDLHDGGFIEVEEKEPGVFTVVNEDFTTKDGNWIADATALGFMSWDDDVVDLDAGNSDAAQCFGQSEKLKWNDVTMETNVMHAPSIERLKEALQHVSLGAWCPGDI